MTHPSHDEPNASSTDAFTAHVNVTHTISMFRVDEGLTVLTLSLNEGEQALSLVLGGNAVSLNAQQSLDLLQWILERRDVILGMTVKTEETLPLEQQKQASPV